MPVINSGLANIYPVESMEFFQSYLKGLLLTYNDRLKLRNEDLKPKIIEYLKKNRDSHFSDLMNYLDADLFEVRSAIEELRSEGKIVGR